MFILKSKYNSILFPGENGAIYEHYKCGCFNALVVYLWHLVLRPWHFSKLGRNCSAELDRFRLRYKKQYDVTTSVVLTNCRHSFHWLFIEQSQIVLDFVDESILRIQDFCHGFLALKQLVKISKFLNNFYQSSKIFNVRDPHANPVF